MHHGLEIKKIRPDYWLLKIKYKHGSCSTYLKTFDEAFRRATQYIHEDINEVSSDFEEELTNILGEVIE